MDLITSKSQDVFHRIPEETLRQVIASSHSIREVLAHMQVCIAGTHYKSFKRICQELNIDLSHFKGTYHRGKPFCRKISSEEFFSENTYRSGSNLASRIKKDSLKPYCCAKCGIVDVWQGEPITLQIDHINGNHSDNRLENLRLLCPNCHSQTPTYAGKRHKKHYHCQKCGKPCSKKAKVCLSCDRVLSIDRLASYNNKITWPDNESLSKMVWQNPASEVANSIGCSLNCLIKHCQKNNIIRPPHGYWQRRLAGHDHEESLKSQKPVRSKKRLMSWVEIQEAAKMIEEGSSVRQVAKRFNFCHTTVARALRRNGINFSSKAKIGRPKTNAA